MTDFISAENFQKAAAEQSKNNVISWSDVPINTIYRINEISPEKTTYGAQLILKLTTLDGTNYRAWACSRLRDELEVLPERKKERLFIKPLGLCDSMKFPDRKYHQYELIKYE